MMSRLLIALGIMLSSSLSPVIAYAYVTPEEALDDENFTTNFFTPPPTPRSAKEIAAEQQERSAQRRAAEQAALNPPSSPASSVDDEETHSAAPDEESDDDIQKLIDALNELQNDEAMPDDDENLTAEELRLLQRIREQQVSGNLSAGNRDEVLHSGAPLSDTGPATILITLAIAGAIGETWRRVRKAEKDASAL